MKKFIIPFFSLALILASCSDDDDIDSVAPVISEITVNGNSTENVTITAGGGMNVGITASDNEELGELKIDLHDIFDDHSHGKSSGINWAEIKNIDLNGTNQSLFTHFQSPSDALAGPYHMIFQVIDAEGNEGDFLEVDFTMFSDDQSNINISAPDFSSEPVWARGDMVTVTGTITDETDISEIVIVLEEEGDHDHGKKQEDALYEVDFDLDGSNDVSWDFQADGNVSFTIPATAEAGHYAFTVNVLDSEGNLSIFEGEVEITE